MSETVEDVVFEAGEVLFDTAQPLSVAYFVLEGSVDLELTLGEKTIMLRIEPNHFVGDAAVAVGQKPNGELLSYRGRAVAAEAVKAAVIPIEDIRRELDGCSPLLKAWIASFTSRILLVIEKLSQTKE